MCSPIRSGGLPLAGIVVALQERVDPPLDVCEGIGVAAPLLGSATYLGASTQPCVTAGADEQFNEIIEVTRRPATRRSRVEG
jgi:hypothetical protein